MPWDVMCVHGYALIPKKPSWLVLRRESQKIREQLRISGLGEIWVGMSLSINIINGIAPKLGKFFLKVLGLN